MKVLIACEESQTVCKAFRARGHEAYSCDIQPCSGGHPEWHINFSVVDLLILPFKWDMMIAFPPCTYVCFAGIRWNVGNADRQRKSDEAIEFFRFLYQTSIPKVCIENPIGIIPRKTGIKWSQIVHPWQFGHEEEKKTCLWLKGLEPLKPTKIMEKREQRVFKMSPGPERSKERSKTFPGIAKAMAEQWG